jgi:hypothetical protein
MALRFFYEKNDHFHNPIESGGGKMLISDHNFVGREVLENIAGWRYP